MRRDKGWHLGEAALWVGAALFLAPVALILLTAFKHFLSKQREKGRAQKRGGGKAPLSLDFAAAESSLDIGPVGGLTPEQIYDRQWAMTLLSQIMERLACEFDRAGKAKQFEA